MYFKLFLNLAVRSALMGIQSHGYSLTLIRTFSSSINSHFRLIQTIQNVFHPPYNKVTSAVAVCSVVGLGYGVMYSGLRHQQKKQGYWK